MEGCHFFVDFVKGIHVHFLIVLLDFVAVLVIFCQLAENGSELDSVIAIFYVL